VGAACWAEAWQACSRRCGVDVAVRFVAPGKAKLNNSEIKALLSAPNSAPYQKVMAQGRRVLQQATRTVPVDNGFLKGSLTMEVIQDQTGGKFGGITVRVAAQEEYAIYVHEGTTRMAPRPFLKNALDQVQF